jgi:hypothetical protein
MCCVTHRKDYDSCYRIHLYLVLSLGLCLVRLFLDEYILCHPNIALLVCFSGIAASLLPTDSDINRRMTHISSGIGNKKNLA